MKTLRTCAALTFLLLALTLSPLGARDSRAAEAEAEAYTADEVLEPMVVTARGYAQALSATPGGVGVVEAEEIRETMPLGVSDALDRIPGVDISTDSPWGAETVIRGMARDSVTVLIDGCRLNGTTDINGRMGLVNPDDVERIEVLKGPISTLYGGGSTGGVVNIITREGRFQETPELHGEVALGYSTNPQGPNTYGNLNYGSDDLWIYASAGWRDHADSYSGGGDVIRNSDYLDIQGKIALGYAWNEENQTTVQYQFTDADDVGIPGTGSAPLPATADVTLKSNDRTFLQLRHAFRPEGGSLEESVLTLSYQLLTRDPVIKNRNTGAVLQDPYAAHETLALNWRNVFDLGEHTFTAGVDAWNWYMTGDRWSGAGVYAKPQPDTEMFSGGLFAEDDWTFAEGWTLNLGGRADGVLMDNEETATVKAGYKNNLDWGGHVGLTWAFAPRWSATAIAAMSYRSPNMLELYKNISLGGGVSEVGNQSLRSEKSRYGELGLHYVGRELRVSASAFVNAVDDLITSEQVSATLYRMANAAEARLSGLEGSVDWIFLPGWSAYGNMAWTEGRNEDTGEWLRFVAPLNGLVGLRNDLDSGFWWALESRWATEQHQVPEDALKTDSWAIVNARCGYGFDAAGLGNELTLAVTNLFDTQYRNHLATSRGVELYAAGIGLEAGWRVKF
ncbi:MAG: TonB-dependent receptor [Desulfovibrio sp.]